MRKKVREVLDAIDEVLLLDDHNASDLWNILAAIRGPDRPDLYNEKGKYTGRIRAIAFPKTALSMLPYKSGVYTTYGSDEDMVYFDSLTVSNHLLGAHWAAHINAAIISINAQDLPAANIVDEEVVSEEQ